MNITILEGARGTGKSTLAFKLRQRFSDTTLVNFTGFHEDGEKGLIKVVKYYKAWIRMLFQMHRHESSFVFDRFFFSERVYSQLYKEYDFKKSYVDLLDDLETLAEMGVKIDILFLTINNDKELKERLIRDKVPFGKAEENVVETLKQQELYKNVFDSLHYNKSSENIRIFNIDTSGKTNEDVYEEIIQLKTT